jgi:hypothetical protein
MKDFKTYYVYEVRFNGAFSEKVAVLEKNIVTAVERFKQNGIKHDSIDSVTYKEEIKI